MLSFRTLFLLVGTAGLLVALLSFLVNQKQQGPKTGWIAGMALFAVGIIGFFLASIA